MDIIGRFRKREGEDPIQEAARRGRQEGRSAAERQFSDTIIFQDAYIAALEREIAVLRGSLGREKSRPGRGGGKGVRGSAIN